MDQPLVYVGINEAKQFISMMGQQKSYVLVKAYQTFYVHHWSTEIVLYRQKWSKTFHIHDGSTQIINIVQQTFYIHVGKNILYRKETKHVYRKGTKHVQDGSKEKTNNKN